MILELGKENGLLFLDLPCWVMIALDMDVMSVKGRTEFVRNFEKREH